MTAVFLLWGDCSLHLLSLFLTACLLTSLPSTPCARSYQRTQVGSCQTHGLAMFKLQKQKAGLVL